MSKVKRKQENTTLLVVGHPIPSDLRNLPGVDTIGVGGKVMGRTYDLIIVTAHAAYQIFSSQPREREWLHQLDVRLNPGGRKVVA